MPLHEINNQIEQVIFNAASKQLASVTGRLLFRIHNVPKAGVFIFRARCTEFLCQELKAAGTHTHCITTRWLLNEGCHKAGEFIEPLVAEGIR